MTPLDLTGTIGLVTDAGNGDRYVIVELDGGDPQAPLSGGISLPLKDELGNDVSGTINDYTLIQAASDGGAGYTLLWKNDTVVPALYVTWNVDAGGFKSGAATAVTDVASLEPLFGVDLDGDGDTDGATTSPLESNGTFGLETNDFTDQYIIVELDGAGVPVVGGINLPITNGGGAVGGTLAGYTMIQVGSDGAGGYTALWENTTDPLNPLYLTWSLDEFGAKNGGATVVTDLVPLEPVFDVDYDEDGDTDGVTAVTTTPLETNGTFGLETDNATGQYIIVELDGAGVPVVGGINLPITNGGGAVGGTLAGYTMIQVGSDGAGGYTALWENTTDPLNPLYLTWPIDEFGARNGGVTVVTDLVPLEPVFDVDYDEDGDTDGVTAVTTTPLETNGTFGLETDNATGQYIIVELDGAGVPVVGGINLPITNGGGAVAGTLAGYTMIQVGSDGAGGYTALWENTTDPLNPLYLTWPIDEFGARNGGVTVVTDLVPLEPVFDVDYDEDGDTDGVTAVTTTPLETNGTFGLETDNATGQYIIVELDGAGVPVVGGINLPITNGGGAVAGTLAGYTMIQVGSDGAGGYTALWENTTDPLNPLYLTWPIDEFGARNGGVTVVTDLVPLEPVFDVDYDEDGDTDGVTAVTTTPLETNGTFGLETDNATGQYIIVELDGAGVPVVGGINLPITNGGGAVAGTLAGYTMIQVGSDGAGGYTALWENTTDPLNPLYLTWPIDEFGARNGGVTVVTDLVPLEPVFDVDYDEDGDTDGVTAVTTTPLETNGTFGLETDNATGQYIIVELDGAGVPVVGGINLPITNGGGAVAGTLAGYTMIQVGSDGAGGYTALWENTTDPLNPLYLTWPIDEFGARNGGVTVVTDLVPLEPVFDVDYDEDGDTDGVTAVTTTPLETNGTFGLETDNATGQYIIVELDGAGVPVVGGINLPITNGGGAVAGTLAGYTMIQVGSDGAGGYTALWENTTDPLNPLYLTWPIDEFGARNGGVTVVTDLVPLEPVFDVDYDEDGDTDGVTAVTTTPLETNGTFGLETDNATGQYIIVELDGAGVPVVGGINLPITNGGGAVAGTLAGYTMIQVGSDGAGGYTALWENTTDPLNPLYLTWAIDEFGAKNGGATVVTDLVPLEPVFDVDYDEDGDTDGITTSVTEVEYIGDFGLEIDDASGAYFIVELDGAGAPLGGGISVGLTDNDGSQTPVTGAISGFVPIQVTSDGAGGYTVLWENMTDPLNPTYVTWDVNSAGTKVGSANAVTDVDALEIQFGADIDGDGFVFIENNGETELKIGAVTDQYTVTASDGSGADIGLTFDLGVSPLTSVQGDVTQAAVDGSGGYVAFAADGFALGEVWSFDAAGVFLSSDVIDTTLELQSWEDTFQFDLDGNGTIDVIA